MLRIHDSDIDQYGRIKESRLNSRLNINFVLVDCSYCQDLRELPIWPNVKGVYCNDCPGLRELPEWPNVTYVNCINCPLLQELPEWPAVGIVDCSRCPNLLKLPEWPNVKEVGCYNCPNLELPLWPDVRFYCEPEKKRRMVKKLKIRTMLLLSEYRYKDDNDDDRELNQNLLWSIAKYL